MLYVTGVSENEVIIADTHDNIKDKISRRELDSIVCNDQLRIYGASSHYNGKADLQALHYPIDCSKGALEKLLKEQKSLNNQWTHAKVQDYLAQVKIGTTIRIDYHGRSDDGGYPYTGSGVVMRKSDDSWYIKDDGFWSDGGNGSTDDAAYVLAVCYLYNTPDCVYVS